MKDAKSGRSDAEIGAGARLLRLQSSAGSDENALGFAAALMALFR
jgi:hypothetical protein